MHNFQDILQQINNNTLAALDLQAVQTLDTATHEERTLSGHRYPVCALAPLSEGRLASGSYDHTIKVWDVQTSRCLQTLSGHSSVVCALAPLSEGRLASGSWDNTIKVWDVQTSQCLQTFKGHSSAVRALAPLSEGRLASGSEDNTIKVWEMQMPLRPLNRDEIIRLLETLTHNDSLTTLSLDDVSLKEASLQKAVLALLSVHPKITHLELINTQVNDTFVEALIGIAKESNLLTTVTLDKNPISQTLLRELQLTLRINAARKGRHADIKQPMVIQPAHPAIKIPSDYLCSVTQVIMSDPVVAADGNTYEREAIEEWLETHDTSPLENTPMPNKHVIPNKTHKRIIGDFLDAHPQLRLSPEFYQSEALRQQLIDAITGSHYGEIQQCINKDPRFLTQPITEGKLLLPLVCECKDHKVLEAVLSLLGETFWELPLPNAGMDYFALAAKHSGTNGAALIAKQLFWEIGEFQEQFYQSLLAQDVTLMDVCLALGATANQADNEGNYPLHLAVNRQQQPMLDYLLQKNALLEATDKVGNSALHLAAQQDNKRMIETLMRAGAHYKKANNAGQRPIDINPFVREMSQQIKTERYIQSFNESLHSNDSIRQLQEKVTALEQEFAILKQALQLNDEITSAPQPSTPTTSSTTTASSPRPSSTHASTFFGGTTPKPANQETQDETPKLKTGLNYI